MKITISKRTDRVQLSCLREDRSYTSASVGPSLPHHDLTHYVVEKHFGLEKGFYGSIKSGYSIDQLGQTEIIRTLDPESLVAEVLTRHFQGLMEDTKKADFRELLNWEAQCTVGDFPAISDEDIDTVYLELQKLVKEFNELPDGGKMELEF